MGATPHGLRQKIEAFMEGLQITKIKATPVKLVYFNNRVIGAFYMGDNYVPYSMFDERITKHLEGKDDTITGSSSIGDTL